MPSTSIGPWEPEGFGLIRAEYWLKRAWVDALETRIQMTDAGLAWLMRVKRIGRRR
jgi:hypothetical protein